MYNYKNKLITVEEAVRFVKSGDDIVTGLGPAVAHGFMSKLHTVAEKVSGVTVNVSLCLNSYDFCGSEVFKQFYGGKLVSYASAESGDEKRIGVIYAVSSTVLRDKKAEI